MKGNFNIWFEIKAMGLTGIIPIIVGVCLLAYSSLHREPTLVLRYVIPAIEMTLPVFAGWWSIFLFYDILEEQGSETIFSYPIKRWKLGIARVTIFFVFYLLLIASTIYILDIWSDQEIFSSLLLQIGFQTFFFAGLGFFVITLTANSGWSLVALMVYSSTQMLTRGSFLPFINIYLFNENILPVDKVLSSSFNSILLGIFLWYGGQVLFNKFNRYR